MPPERVFKTLVVRSAGDLAVAVLPVDRQLDLKAAAAALGLKKLDLAPPAEAERATGYVVGGISPLGARRRLPVVLDAGSQRFETVLVSAGRRGLDVELAPADLARLTGAVLADVSR